MRYLITHPDHRPFYSNAMGEKWVEGTTAFDLFYHAYTTDGHTWEDVEIDSL
jgi:hypothetical protein